MRRRISISQAYPESQHHQNGRRGFHDRHRRRRSLPSHPRDQTALNLFSLRELVQGDARETGNRTAKMFSFSFKNLSTIISHFLLSNILRRMEHVLRQ